MIQEPVSDGDYRRLLARGEAQEVSNGPLRRERYWLTDVQVEILKDAGESDKHDKKRLLAKVKRY